MMIWLNLLWSMPSVLANVIAQPTKGDTSGAKSVASIFVFKGTYPICKCSDLETLHASRPSVNYY